MRSVARRVNHFAIGHERELRCVHTTNLNRPRVIQCAAGIEHLLDERPLRIFDVDDGQALRPVRDIGVRARDIQPARIFSIERLRGEAEWAVSVR